MKRKLLFFIILSCIFFQISAQSTVDFQYVSQLLAKQPLTTGTFKQTKTITKIKRNLISSGDFIINADKGIAWITKKPFPSTLVVGKAAMIQISADGTKSITDTSENKTFSDISNTIASIFCGKNEIIQKQFSVSFSKKSTSNSCSWVAVLFPENKTIQSFMTKITLQGVCPVSGTSSKAQITSVIISETSGDKILYEFSDQEHPETLSKEQYEFFKK